MLNLAAVPAGLGRRAAESEIRNKAVNLLKIKDEAAETSA